MVSIKELPIFKGLDVTSVSRIEDLVYSVTYPDKTVLFDQGAPSNSFYIIQTGAVSVIREDDGIEHELAVLEVGNFFGEMGILDDSPRSASCITKGETSVLIIRKDEFLKMMATNPTISRHVMAALMKRACTTTGTHASVSPFSSADSSALPSSDLSSTGVAQVSKGAIIGMFSASGGVGITFLSANIAYALSEMTGKKVLVADLDLMFGDQGVMFDTLPERSLEDLIGLEKIDSEQILNCVMSTKTKVDILQAPKRPENAEAIDGAMIIQILELLRQHYDYIICDTTHVVQDFNIHVLDLVQIPIYVLTPDLFGLKNCARWYDLMRKIQYDVDKVEFLINKSTENDTHAAKWLDEKFSKVPVAIVPMSVKEVKASIDSGQLLAKEESDSLVAVAVNKVAAEIAGVEVPDDSSSSWWSKWIPL